MNLLLLVGIVKLSLCFVLWVALIVLLKKRYQKDAAFLLFFTLFFVYGAFVIELTLLEYQSLLVLKAFLPHLMLKGQPEGQGLNLVPLVTLTPGDLKTSLLNVLMMVPFGMGLPILVRGWRLGRVTLAGGLASLTIEVLQFVSGWAAHQTFRVADINDVIFNTGGAALGYGLLVGLVRLLRRLIPVPGPRTNPIVRLLLGLTVPFRRRKHPSPPIRDEDTRT